jgi:glycosyltransferase involved in cell wall biosynthesis
MAGSNVSDAAPVARLAARLRRPWSRCPNDRSPVRDRPLVLLTLADVPWPADGGKRLRAASILEGLGAVADVDAVVLAPAAGMRPGGWTSGVRRLEHIDLPLRHPVFAAPFALARRVPWQIAVRRWRAARRVLRDRRTISHDVVWFGSLDHAVSLRRAVRARHVVVDVDDVEPAKAEAFLALSAGGRVERLQRRVELPLWRSVQRRVARHADRLVVCSSLDACRLGTHAAVVPNTYPDPGDGAGAHHHDAHRLLLVATYGYEPNADAALWLVRDVLPRLLALDPAARVRLVGRGIDRLTDIADEPGVDIVGPVDDVGLELRRAAAVVVPVRYGGGTRVKILEAFAWRVPVISTSVGCEGLDVGGGVHLEIADDPDAFARACARVIEDRAHAATLTANARALYERHYAPAAGAAAIGALIDDLVCAGDRRRVPDR